MYRFHLICCPLCPETLSAIVIARTSTFPASFLFPSFSNPFPLFFPSFSPPFPFLFHFLPSSFSFLFISCLGVVFFCTQLSNIQQCFDIIYLLSSVYIPSWFSIISTFHYCAVYLYFEITNGDIKQNDVCQKSLPWPTRHFYKLR